MRQGGGGDGPSECHLECGRLRPRSTRNYIYFDINQRRLLALNLGRSVESRAASRIGAGGRRTEPSRRHLRDGVGGG